MPAIEIENSHASHDTEQLREQPSAHIFTSDSAPGSILYKGRDVEHIPVQKVLLSDLKYHIESISISQQKFDWISILLGCATSTTISTILEFLSKGANLKYYVVLTIFLWIISYAVSEHHKGADKSPSNIVHRTDAIRALAQIYEAGNLEFTSDSRSDQRRD